MFYKMYYDMNLNIDEQVYIYADKTNLNDIEYKDFKKGFFDNVIYNKSGIEDFPEVVFSYESEISNCKNDLLLNVKRWPLVHERVKDELIKNDIKDVDFYPIILLDRSSGKATKEYYLLYTKDFIDAYDLSKSDYTYNEKYNFYSFSPVNTFLNQSICFGHDIFRCIRNVTPLFVSEKIKKIVEDNGFSGFCFETQR